MAGLPDGSGELGGSDVSDRARIRGCLLGGAVGDALGAQVEFLSVEEIRTRFGPAGPAHIGTMYGRAGAFTDDTQMTLFTAEGLLRAHTRMGEKGIADVPGVVLRAYQRWLYTQGERARSSEGDGGVEVAGSLDGWLVHDPAVAGRRAPGNSCLSALRQGRTGTVEAPINDSKGCGAVMRMAPVGLLVPDPGEAFSLGVKLGALTHGHPSGHLPAGAFAAVVSALMGGATMAAAFDIAVGELARWPGHDDTTRFLLAAIAGAETGPPTPHEIDGIGGGGWWGDDALAIAARVVLSCTDVTDALRRAVNHSGDSDSTGSLVGNLLGVQLGEAALPETWLAELDGADVVAAVADDLATARAGEAPSSWRYETQPDGTITSVNTDDPRFDAWWARYPGW